MIFKCSFQHIVKLFFLTAVGDSVQEDEEVCHIETDKTSIPVKAPCNGVITELCVEDGATVQPGAKLFIVSSSGIECNFFYHGIVFTLMLP